MKSKRWYKIFTFVSSMLPLIAIIVSARVAYTIMTAHNASEYATSIAIVGNII